MGAVALLIASLFGQAPVRTADITLRGLTSADFPRVTTLADNVYAYEQIDPTKRTVTVNNLIVITTAGVLIAESQGTVENVRRLVADVARLTAQPIKYVVVEITAGLKPCATTRRQSGVTQRFRALRISVVRGVRLQADLRRTRSSM